MTDVTQRESEAEDSTPRPYDVVASCATLFALAVAQPLLDLLGRNAEFFVARKAPPLDIVILAVALGVVIPIVIGVVVIGLYRVHVMVGGIAHSTVIVLLGGLLVLEIIGHSPLESLPVSFQVGLAILAGVALAGGFFRWDTIRNVFRLGSIAVLVVPVVFLFFTPTSRLIQESGTVIAVAGVIVTDPAPIVVLVFDELPVASLMDGDGNLQSDVYPGFARLADEATWFRNAVTVQRLTQFSVPAIITGISPAQDLIPTAGDHPNNLFTLLSGSYDIDALESMTALCPRQTCQDDDRSAVSTRRRWEVLLQDLRIVGSYVLLPDDLTDHLPPIDQAWADFAAEAPSQPIDPIDGFSENDDLRSLFRGEVQAGRGATVEAFVQGIEPPSDRPTIDFAHVLLPHAPWEYLPTGQRYVPPARIPGSAGQTWLDDPWLVNQAYQLHLVQVQYADHLVEQMISRLTELGMYDDAIVVVTADHGIVFRPDVENRRAATEMSVGDLAAIPLFIKLPHSRGGGIDDYRAETVDVLPTIADTLGIRLPWETEGVPLFGEDRPVRAESVITGGGTVVFGTDGREKFEVAAHKVRVFGDSGPWGLAPEGTADLLGVRIDDLDVGEASSVIATIESPEGFARVDTRATFLPVLVQGTVQGDSLEGHVVVAIGVNGVVSAVTRTYQRENGTLFYGLLPPASLTQGRNEIDLVMVDQVGDARRLTLIGP